MGLISEQTKGSGPHMISCTERLWEHNMLHLQLLWPSLFIIGISSLACPVKSSQAVVWCERKRFNNVRVKVGNLHILLSRQG